MSSTPNQFPRSSKPASSSKSRTEAQANSAIEPSSSAETMTDQTPDSMLMTPPTRMTSPDSADSQPETSPSVSSKAVKSSASTPPDSPSIAEVSEPVKLTASTEVSEPTAKPVSAEASVASAQAASAQAASAQAASAQDTSAQDTSAQSELSQPEPVVAVDPEINAEAHAESEDNAAAEVAGSSAGIAASPEESAPKAAPRHQPIPPASEPMQYRAIGLVRGRYTPSEEQFTRGSILTEDGVIIDAVLLGRVMSLVKKHIDLAEPHLWVVYPRTRDKELDLHMQIVGVWEPEKLNRSSDVDASALASGHEGRDEDEDDEDEDDLELELEQDDPDTEAAIEPDLASDVAEAPEISEVTAAQPLNTPEEGDSEASTPPQREPALAGSDDSVPAATDLDDRYFSVRGEVVFQSDEDDRLLIKIRRAPKPGTTQAKAFKVALKGKLDGKGLGYFWDFQVQREANELVVKEATQIGMVPPQKRKGSAGGGGRRGGPGRPGGGGGRRPGAGGPPRQRWQNQNREGSVGGSRPTYRDRGDRPERSDRTSQPSTPRQPIAKPVKRRKPDEP